MVDTAQILGSNKPHFKSQFHYSVNVKVGTKVFPILLCCSSDAASKPSLSIFGLF